VIKDLNENGLMIAGVMW